MKKHEERILKVFTPPDIHYSRVPKQITGFHSTSISQEDELYTVSGKEPGITHVCELTIQLS